MFLDISNSNNVRALTSAISKLYIQSNIVNVLKSPKEDFYWT